jgi:hypothetical protein
MPPHDVAWFDGVGCLCPLGVEHQSHGEEVLQNEQHTDAARQHQ